MSLLRDALLSGRRVTLSGSASETVSTALAGLGAELVKPAERAEVVVHDSRSAFEDSGLIASLEQAWSAVAQAANESLIPQGGGKIVLIAPRRGAATGAEAARDALENLARTLSTEWARYGITTTAIAPGAGTTKEELAALVCFLASPAGDYFSGCRFDLGRVSAP